MFAIYIHFFYPLIIYFSIYGNRYAVVIIEMLLMCGSAFNSLIVSV